MLEYLVHFLPEPDRIARYSARHQVRRYLVRYPKFAYRFHKISLIVSHPVTIPTLVSTFRLSLAADSFRLLVIFHDISLPSFHSFSFSL